MEPLLVIGIFVALGAFAYWRNPARRIKRELRAAPSYRIDKLDEGELGRIIGKARVHDEKLVAPLTGRECVYYIACVDEDDGEGGWKNAIEEERGVTFLLEDDSGRALVDPSPARLALDFDCQTTSGALRAPDERETQFLEKHDFRGRGLIFRKRLRYREAVIEIGEEIAVLGAGTREPDPTRPPAGYREGPPTLLRVTSSAGHLLVISDDPSTTR